MSFFDEVETTVANTRFLQAQEDNAPITLILPEWSDPHVKEFETKVREKLSTRRLMRSNTIGYYLFKKWLGLGGPPEANGGRREDVVAMCHAIDEYRKSGQTVRRDKAKAIMVSHMDFNPDMLVPQMSRARNDVRDRERRAAAEAKALSDAPHNNASSSVAASVAIGHVDADNKEEKKTVTVEVAGEQKVYRQLSDDHHDDKTTSTSNTTAAAPTGLVSATLSTDTPVAVAMNHDNKDGTRRDGSIDGTQLLFVPINSNTEHPPIPGIVVTPIADSATPSSPNNNNANGLPANGFAAASLAGGHPTSVSSSSLPPVRPPAGSLGRAPSSPNQNTAGNGNGSNGTVASSSSTTPTSPAVVQSGSESAVTPGGAAEGNSGTGGNGNNGVNGIAAISSPLAISPMAAGGDNGMPLSFNTLPSSVVVSGAAATSSSLSSSVLSMPSPAAVGPIITRFTHDWNGQSKKDLGKSWPPEVLEQLLRYFDTPNPPNYLFDNVSDALGARLEDRLPHFMAHELYKKYVRLEQYARQPVKLKDFRVFRVLGRGAFGAVSAVQKVDTHAIFAMKEMGKRQVKLNQSEWMVNNEKKVLSKMRSPFVLNLKYSFHTEETLYLIFDMCSGGDLKFHLKANATSEKKDRSFSNERSRFYAAEVLLGLEHIHSFDIVYRDLKPNNILLDAVGHVKISDLGLTIKLRNKPLKHLAGTGGYWAPEIVMKEGTYKVSDYWSFGVFLYEMLSGRRPRCKCAKKTNEWCPFGQKRTMEENALKEGALANLKIEVEYPPDKFSPEARDLLQRLFVVDPAKRLGANGASEIKSHPYFSPIDWQRLEAVDVPPPFTPDPRTVHADSIAEVGEFNKNKFSKIKLGPEDEKQYEGFTYISPEGVQAELVTALEKQDHPSHPTEAPPPQKADEACCVIL